MYNWSDTHIDPSDSMILNSLALKIWLLILPTSCYNFPVNLLREFCGISR